MSESADYIIVLGSRLKNNDVTSTLRHRLETAAFYWKSHPDVVIMVTGGRTGASRISEARAMKEYLMSKHQIPSGCIIEEDESQTTIENFINCRKIIPEDAVVAIVTTYYHMYRAGKYARSQGFDKMIYLPAKSDLRVLPKNLCREILAILKGKLTGTLR